MAWQNGRYDDAAAFVAAESLRDYLPAKQLAQQVAGKLVDRAGERFANGDSLAGWQDLAKADHLGGQAESIGQLRRRYADRVLDEAGQYLAAGQMAAALSLLEKLRQRGALDERARRLRQIAQLASEADQAAAQGHFGEARRAYAHAAELAEPLAAEGGRMDEIANRLNEQRAQHASHADQCQRLNAEMHAALAAENWSLVLSAADALLAMAPRHAAAGQARRRAWKAVGMDVTRVYAGRRQDAWPKANRLPISLQAGPRSPRSTHTSRSSEVDTLAGKEQPKRALLWIDAVGGYLVCFDDTIVLGQPSPGDCVAVPILADLSRRHAVIRRDAGAYVLEPLQSTSVAGREITGPHVLADNDLIQLGDNVRLRFARPHALSATARLTLESHHKTQPSADAVLLMADSCVLGPNRHCHVPCRDWQHDVVLYRQDDRLFCRADKPLTIDGLPSTGASEIQPGARVEGEEFSLTWETVE